MSKESLRGLNGLIWIKPFRTVPVTGKHYVSVAIRKSSSISSIVINLFS